LLDVGLVELVFGLPPELSFDPRYDRPLVRRAMRDLLPDTVRLRRDKVSFTALLLDALVETDRSMVDATLRTGALELGPSPTRTRCGVPGRTALSAIATAAGSGAWRCGARSPRRAGCAARPATGA
jgi:hypothetical protein